MSALGWVLALFAGVSVSVLAMTLVFLVCDTGSYDPEGESRYLGGSLPPLRKRGPSRTAKRRARGAPRGR